MFIIHRILALLSRKEKQRMGLLFAAILVMALVEVAGVASIMPFMAVLASSEVEEITRYFVALY